MTNIKKEELIPLYIGIKKGYPFSMSEDQYNKEKSKDIYHVENRNEDIYILNYDEDSLKPLVNFLIYGGRKRSMLKTVLIIFFILLFLGGALTGVYYLIKDKPEAKITTNTQNQYLVPPKNTETIILNNEVKQEETATGSQNTEQIIQNAVNEVKKQNTDLQNKLAIENKLYYCESENERLKFDLQEEKSNFNKMSLAVDKAKDFLDNCELEKQTLDIKPIDNLYNSIGRDIYGHCEKDNLSENQQKNCESLYINYLKKYGLQ